MREDNDNNRDDDCPYQIGGIRFSPSTWDDVEDTGEMYLLYDEIFKFSNPELIRRYVNLRSDTDIARILVRIVATIMQSPSMMIQLDSKRSRFRDLAPGSCGHEMPFVKLNDYSSANRMKARHSMESLRYDPDHWSLRHKMESRGLISDFPSYSPDIRYVYENDGSLRSLLVIFTIDNVSKKSLTDNRPCMHSVFFKAPDAASGAVLEWLLKIFEKQPSYIQHVVRGIENSSPLNTGNSHYDPAQYADVIFLPNNPRFTGISSQELDTQRRREKEEEAELDRQREARNLMQAHAETDARTQRSRRRGRTIALTGMTALGLLGGAIAYEARSEIASGAQSIVDTVRRAVGELYEK